MSCGVVFGNWRRGIEGRVRRLWMRMFCGVFGR